MKRALLCLALALALVPPARAHRGLHVRGYTSTIAALDPNVVGVFVNVLGGDDRLRLSNYSGKTVAILGYAGEPYLRFTRRGVYENFRSPNAYLDHFRYPPGGPPPAANAKAPPRWVRVADGVTFEWHDHRIHWRKRTAPDVVRDDPDHVHLILNWRVPALANRQRFAIEGFLGYTPPPENFNGDGWLIPAVGAAAGAAALVAAGLGLRARRERRRAR